MTRSMSLGMLAALAMLVGPLPVAARSPIHFRWTHVVVGVGGYVPDMVFRRAAGGLADHGNLAGARLGRLQEGKVVPRDRGIRSLCPDRGAPCGPRAGRRLGHLGKHWRRINGEGHQLGLRFRTISGNPRVADRACPGTDGGGLFCGDPSGERK